MRARSRFAALAIGLAISCWPNRSIAQAGEVEELHERILALDSTDQTFEAIPLAKEYAAAIEKKSGSDTAAYAIALDILVAAVPSTGRSVRRLPSEISQTSV